MAQMIQRLPSKCKALSLNPSTTKKRKRKTDSWKDWACEPWFAYLPLDGNLIPVIYGRYFFPSVTCLFFWWHWSLNSEPHACKAGAPTT
jgi:hypothetical protein